MSHPLFSDEGPEYYAAAFGHNAPFAQGAPYRTALGPADEQKFRAWVQQYRVPFNPDENPSDYDMRGYWKGSGGAPHAAGQHFPDTYKTPYDTTFSGESMYAKPGTPFAWKGDVLIDTRNGEVIYAEPAAGKSEGGAGGAHPSGYGTLWHAVAVAPDGSQRTVPLAQRFSAGGETHWDADLLDGEQLMYVTQNADVTYE